MAPRPLPFPFLLAAAALLGAPAGASARAPAASDQGSLDGVLDRLQADRAEDQKGPRADPLEQKCVAYLKGETPLDEWTPIADIVRKKEGVRPEQRRRAVDVIIGRFTSEQEKSADPREKGLDSRVLWKVKKEIGRSLLDLMTDESDSVGRTCISRITEFFFPQSQVQWRPEDPRGKRLQARADLLKYLNKK